MNPQSQVLELLEDNGFALVRERKHMIYRNPDGLVFVTTSTPSDRRGWQNNLHDLRRVLGNATVSPEHMNSIPVTSSSGTMSRRHLGIDAKTRSLGITRERWERQHKLSAPAPVMVKASSKVETLVDIYRIGAILRRQMHTNFSLLKEEPDHVFESLLKMHPNEVPVNPEGLYEFIRERTRAFNVALEQGAVWTARRFQRAIRDLRAQRVLEEKGMGMELYTRFVNTFEGESEGKVLFCVDLTRACMRSWKMCREYSRALSIRFREGKIEIEVSESMALVDTPKAGT